MKTIQISVTDGNAFRKIHLEGDEVVKVLYSRQIDDFLVTADGGDFLMSWDMHEWDDEQCVLIREKDNFKELSGITGNILLFKSKDGAPVTLFTCAQIN